jgi:hypothetical protein
VALTRGEVERFVADGFVKVQGAFPAALAQERLRIMWRDTGCVEDDPSTWTRPVVRLPGYALEPFRRAANTGRLHEAFDQLVGAGRWLERTGLGTIAVRFPHPDAPGDDGWHIEGSYLPEGGADGPYFVNLVSRDRALLMLFLFSEVTERDAPTRVRVGSHLAVPACLAPAGEGGMSFEQVGATGLFDATAHLPQALVTGSAGDVYLCHPFLVHAAQPHRGATPRFMAQPPLYPNGALQLERPDGGYSPVEQAIRLGLAGVAGAGGVAAR